MSETVCKAFFIGGPHDGELREVEKYYAWLTVTVEEPSELPGAPSRWVTKEYSLSELKLGSRWPATPVYVFQDLTDLNAVDRLLKAYAASKGHDLPL